jgi:hypothetical protein
MNTELISLQTMADNLEIGMTIHEKWYQDKRKKVKMYFATIQGHGTISPVLDYSNLTHFLLGMHKAKKLNFLPQ